MPKTKSPTPDRALLDAFWREPVERTVLANGLTLLVKPDRSAALASVQVWVRTGSIHEGGQLGAGLSHFLEHMLFKGTDRRSGPRDLRDRAGERRLHQRLHDLRPHGLLHRPAERAPRGGGRPPRRRRPALDAAGGRGRAREGRDPARDRDDPGRPRQPALGGGLRDRVPGAPLPPADHRPPGRVRRCRPRGAPRVLPGALRPEQHGGRHRGRRIDPRRRARASSGISAPRPGARLAPVLVPAEPLQLGPRSLHRYENVEIARAALAWPIPGLTDPAAPTLDLLALVLGGGDSSVLWREIREKRKLVHAIDASSWNPGSSGLFCISFTCDAGKRGEAEAAILRVVASMAAPGCFEARQVRKAYRQSVVGEINTCKTMSGQASRLGMAEVVVGDLEFSRTYFERLGKVGPADLGRALKAHLVPSRLMSVSLEPESAAVSSGKSRSPAATGARPDFEELRLPNGARIVFQEDRRLPNLHLRLLTLGGPVGEAAGRRGSSALLATLLTKDTRRHGRRGGRAHDRGGGRILQLVLAATTPSALALEVLPARRRPRARAPVADGALEPAFKAETLGTEREAQLAGLQGGERRRRRRGEAHAAREVLRRAPALPSARRATRTGVSATAAADLPPCGSASSWGRASCFRSRATSTPDRLCPKAEGVPQADPQGAGARRGPAVRGPRARRRLRREAAARAGGRPAGLPRARHRRGGLLRRATSPTSSSAGWPPGCSSG